MATGFEELYSVSTYEGTSLGIENVITGASLVLSMPPLNVLRSRIINILPCISKVDCAILSAHNIIFEEEGTGATFLHLSEKRDALVLYNKGLALALFPKTVGESLFSFSPRGHACMIDDSNLLRFVIKSHARVSLRLVPRVGGATLDLTKQTCVGGKEESVMRVSHFFGNAEDVFCFNSDEDHPPLMFEQTDEGFEHTGTHELRGTFFVVRFVDSCGRHYRSFHVGKHKLKERCAVCLIEGIVAHPDYRSLVRNDYGCSAVYRTLAQFLGNSTFEYK